MQKIVFIFAIVLPSMCLAQVELPDGFELVEVVSDGTLVRVPAINNCGEIVFAQSAPEHEQQEIYKYDNGLLERVTFGGGVWPDINDLGTMVWCSGTSILMLQDELVYLGGCGVQSGPAKINNLNHVVWDWFEPITCASESTILFYDGENVTPISDSVFSNQSPKLNDCDDIVWTRYDFCQSPWQSEIVLYSGDEETILPNTDTQVQGPTINNAGQVVWSAYDGLMLWEDGIATTLTDWGRSSSLNNLGDIHFMRWHEEDWTWDVWYYQASTGTPTFYRLTDEDRWHSYGDINDYGEAVWWSFADPYNPDVDCGLHYMRRIRNGDVDFDGDVDLDDFATLPDCMTGPIETDRLCDCRFFDMDHDRDIDLTDLTLFQAAFGSAP